MIKDVVKMVVVKIVNHGWDAWPDITKKDRQSILALIGEEIQRRYIMWGHDQYVLSGRAVRCANSLAMPVSFAGNMGVRYPVFMIENPETSSGAVMVSILRFDG